LEEWIGKYDGDESKGRESGNIFVEELDRFCCVEKRADKEGEGASKFSGNDEDAGEIKSQEEEPGLSVFKLLPELFKPLRPLLSYNLESIFLIYPLSLIGSSVFSFW